MHQNIAGVLHKKDSLEIVLLELETKSVSVDIVCISETFMKKGTESNLLLQNYKLVSSFSRPKQRRGGTCILVKKELDCEAVRGLPTPLIYTFEFCAIEIVTLNVYVICIYRIPNSNVKQFFERLIQVLTKLTKKSNKNVIVCGDWNIDVLKNDSVSKELCSILNNYNITNHVCKPTRKNSCIDLITSNMSKVNTDIHYVALSDHETCQTITFKANLSTVQCKNKFWFEEVRDINCENTQKFIDCVSSLSFSDVFETEDTNAAFNCFHDTFTLFYNLCFPKILVKMNKKPIRNHWITKGIKKCSIKKRCLYIKYRLSNANKKQNLKSYEKYSKTLRKCIFLAHKLNNARYLLNSKNKNKASWQIIKNINNDVSHKNDINTIISDGKIYSEPNTIANEFNKFFINISNNSNPLSELTTYNHYESSLKHYPNSIYLTPVHKDDILKIIASLKNTNSTGYDDINTKILKLCSTSISEPLAHIINLSLYHGVFPDRLKLSIVKPLFKKGDKTDFNNYRPITLIPILSKVFEKAIHVRIYNFFTKYQILKSEQFGFTKNKSTTLACFNLINLVTTCLNKRIPITSIFIDMSKAFDFVDHKLLLLKLNRYGIRGNALKLIEDYLGGRTQCVEVSSYFKNRKAVVRSQYKPNNYGVPQGSILGPLLFIIYINDLPNITTHKCVLYADDITINIQNNTNNIEYEKEINRTLVRIIDWLRHNNLQINISKTKMIRFQTYNTRQEALKIEYKDNVVSEVENTRFLGITIDKYCNWKAHIDNLCIKLEKFVYVLYRLRRVANMQAALSAYHGYVSSVIRYGLIIWGNSVDSIRVFRGQKKCIRSLCGLHQLDSCIPYFQKHHILPLPSMYIFEISVFVHKNSMLFEKHNDVVERASRQKHKLNIPKQRIQLYSRNVFCMAIHIYNKLPACFKEMNIRNFKNNLFKFLLSKCYYSISDFLNEKPDWKF